MLAEGVVHFGEKCLSAMAFAARKWEMSAVVMGEKMMTGIAKNNQRLQSVSWIGWFVFN